MTALDLNDFRALVALAEAGHFGRAADRLGVSQPALTKRVRLMEERMGGRLFERLAQGTRLTAAGAVLTERARQLLGEAEAAEEQTRSVLRGTSGELRIGAGLTTLFVGLPEVLGAFHRRYPEVRLTVRDMASGEQAEALRRGELDVGFLRQEAAGPGLAVEAMRREELRLVAAAKGPRSRRALWESPFVMLARSVSPTFHDHVQATCRAVGVTPRVGQETNQLLTVLALVQAGIGVSLVPGSVGSMGIAGLRMVEVGVPEAAWTVAMAWRREAVEGTPLRHFLGLARRRWVNEAGR
jgi:DNA-binding transcriptional LysR family regulator